MVPFPGTVNCTSAAAGVMQAHARTGGQEEEPGSGASTPRSHMSSPWGTDASESDEEDTVFSAAAAARHALASQGTASKAVNEANQAKMRETGVTGGSLHFCTSTAAGTCLCIAWQVHVAADGGS